MPTSELIDPAYPGAHLPLGRRYSLAPRWKNPHLTLYAFPKAFLSKPETPYDKPYKLRPYPAPPRRPDERNADMSMQVLASNSRIIVRPTLRVKIKRRLREAIKLIVTRGAAVEKSRKGPKVVFRPEDVGADKWIAPGVFLSTFSRSPSILGDSKGVCFLLTMGLTQIGRTSRCPPQSCSVRRLRSY